MDNGPAVEKKRTAQSVILRVAVFSLLVYPGMVLFAWVLVTFGGYLVSSAVGVFLSAVVANELAMRIFERSNLAEVGLTWTPGSVRNLLVGLAGGTGAACLVLVTPLVARVAELQPDAASEFHWRSLLFLMVLLLFGAVGEELMFRGYAFQVLLGALGPFATILPMSLLFGLSHANNLGISLLGLVNTTLWGVILGASFLRSGDLWLPIGLHAGWNWALPLFGVNLSGFTMNVTGYAMRWRIGALWSGGEYGPEGGILCTLVLVVLALYLWKAPVRRQIPFLMRSHWEA